MSDSLFDIDLEGLKGDLKSDTPLYEWPEAKRDAFSIITQVGMMERIELLIELQAMLVGAANPLPKICPADKLLLQIREHYGWENVGE